MPRFLNTWTGQFEWHNDPAKVRYAILSHVWRTPEEGGEQTFEEVKKIQTDLRKLRARLKRFPSRVIAWPAVLYNSRRTPPNSNAYSEIFAGPSPLSDKIKGLCKVAREAGFDLVWNDACCIDKSSSAELSEAINSMYEWYRLSDMCYVYLADVPDGEDPRRSFSCFRTSKWHWRGWTLQELVAPGRIEFLTKTWTFIGTKMGLADDLADRTGIHLDILTSRAPVDSASVAQRISWAARRQTTRVEDQAYCLMGLFGVHMSPIYGEGANAFLRLQEEIVRTIPDQSIFAWGAEYAPIIHPPEERRAWSFWGYRRWGGTSDPGLLASSPSSFFCASSFRPIPPADFSSRLQLKGIEDVPPLHCIFTPEGVRMRLVCLNFTDIPRDIQAILRGMPPERLVLRWCEHCMRRAPDRLALLQCEDDHGNLPALPLHSPLGSEAVGMIGRGSPIGAFVRCDPCTCEYRYETLHAILLSRETLAIILDYAGTKPEAAEVTILHHYPDPPRSKSLRNTSLPCLGLWPRFGRGEDGLNFALAPRIIRDLRALGFTTSPLQVTRDRSWTRTTLETTLTLFEKESRRCNNQCLQSIRLRLSLDKLSTPMPLGDHGGSDTKFCFSITNLLHAQSPKTPSPPGVPRGSTSTESMISAMKEVPCAGGGERIEVLPTEHVEYEIVLASADFLVPAYPELPGQMRLLRISLERAPDSLKSPLQQSWTVWLVVEMSAAHGQDVSSSGS